MKKRNLYCGGGGLNPGKALSAWLHAGGDEVYEWPQFNGKNVILTHKGRVAIVLALQIMNISPGDEVLVPAYNCGSEVDPILSIGAKVVFYRVNVKARIDLDDIRSRLTSRTRVIYVTHYFGWSQNLTELAGLCKEQNLVLIEDCALSLFSDGSRYPIGRTGDAAVYSFPKSLPVPEGGALVLPEDNEKISNNLNPPEWHRVYPKMLPLFKRWLIRTGEKMKDFGLSQKLLGKSFMTHTPGDQKKTRNLLPISDYFDKNIINKSISRITKGILNQLDYREIVRIRRRNYTQLYNSVCDSSGIQPLYNDFPEGICPLGVPVRVPDRQQVISDLNNRGIVLSKWWAGYHRSLSWEDFPDACELKDHLLLLPVHQDLDDDHIHYIADCVKSLSLT